MAYRTYVGTTGKNSIQILGNNEFYQPFIDEIKRQGIYVGDDCCFGIQFEEDDTRKSKTAIKEIQPFIDILEQYIWEKDKETKLYKADIFNLRYDSKKHGTDFTYAMKDLQENAYIFVTANLINYLQDNLERHFDYKKKKFVYKIKEGKEVWFEAY